MNRYENCEADKYLPLREEAGEEGRGQRLEGKKWHERPEQTLPEYLDSEAHPVQMFADGPV